MNVYPFCNDIITNDFRNMVIRPTGLHCSFLSAAISTCKFGYNGGYPWFTCKLYIGGFHCHTIEISDKASDQILSDFTE